MKHFKEPSVTDKWIVSDKETEISIVQEKDVHGRISHGWFSESKILISESAYTSDLKSPVHEQIVLLAQKEADERNKEL